MLSHCFKIFFVIMLTLVLSAGAISAQSSSFTYQGQLSDGASPANGSYDLQFALFDTANSSVQIGQTQTVSNVPVTAGIFTVTLDFGANAFPGASRFLEIRTRPTGSGAFTLLTPRQQLTSMPYAVRSLNTGTADVAANAQQLGGVAANQYVKTDDARLSNARVPTPGSTDYIQNLNTTPQPANFTIAGNGTVAGVLSGNTLNAGFQFNFAGQRFLTRTANGGHLIGVTNAPLALGDNANIGIGTFTPTTALANGRALDIEGQSAVLRLGATVSNGKAWEWQSKLYGANAAMTLSNATDGRDVLTVLGNGNVGIGTTNPITSIPNATTLSLRGNDSVLRLESDRGNTAWEWQSSATNGTAALNLSLVNLTDPTFIRNPLSVLVTGNVGIGTIQPTAKLEVNGNVKLDFLSTGGSVQLCRNAAAEISSCSSSRRYKTDFLPFTGGLNVVNRLSPLTFKWKADQTLDLGFGAEDVAAVEPLLVTHNENGQVEGVKYDRLSAVFVNAFKEQQDQIASLQAANDALNTRLRVLEQTMNRHRVPRRRR